MTARCLGVLASMLLWLCATPLASAEDPATAMARRMGRGVNILGYDGLWDGGTDAPFRRSEFAAIKKAGFSHVRINLHAFKHMSPDGNLDRRVLTALDWAVENALANGLVPVVDEHDFSDCQQDPQGCAARLRTFWRQLAVHYAGRHPDLVFELLNEPGGNLSPAAWNDLVGDLLLIVRASNPDRVVIVAAINSEDSRSASDLALPRRDRALIVTVHYYKPFRFTHQGAPWAELGHVRDVDWGSPSDRAALKADFATIQDWAAREERPVYLGEFGVYEAAGRERRARWMEFVAREAERLGWPWAAWQYDHDFSLIDNRTRRWHPNLLRALVPRP